MRRPILIQDTHRGRGMPRPYDIEMQQMDPQHRGRGMPRPYDIEMQQMDPQFAA